MPIRTFETQMSATAEELFSWHARPGAFERLCPPWQALQIEIPAPVANGSRVQLLLRKGPLTFRCSAEHRDVEPGRGFTDVMTALPFARWIHRHDFEKAGSGSLLRDRIDYELAGGGIGRALAGRQVARDLATTFAFRHETTTRDLACHRAFANERRLRVAVSGSNGLVGQNLVPFLTTGGHRVVRLTRTASGQPFACRWLTSHSRACHWSPSAFPARPWSMIWPSRSRRTSSALRRWGSLNGSGLPASQANEPILVATRSSAVNSAPAPKFSSGSSSTGRASAT